MLALADVHAPLCRRGRQCPKQEIFFATSSSFASATPPVPEFPSLQHLVLQAVCPLREGQDVALFFPNVPTFLMWSPALRSTQREHMAAYYTDLFLGLNTKAARYAQEGRSRQKKQKSADSTGASEREDLCPAWCFIRTAPVMNGCRARHHSLDPRWAHQNGTPLSFQGAQLRDQIETTSTHSIVIGLARHMSLLYSNIVLSLENLPAPATFMIDFFVHNLISENSFSTCLCVLI